MRAIVCTAYGPAGQLQFGEVPEPRPGPRELVVDVHAAGVGFMDVLMAEGKYQMKPALPYVPGTDAAGVVRAVGAEVTRFRPGDRVACGHWHGAWAEQMRVGEDSAAPLPASVDFATGAAFRYAYGTARYALVTTAKLQAGEVLFVSGAAGGVGLAAVDLGRHLGARVIAGVGSADKAETVRRYGADAVVVYGEEDLKERIRALTDGQGVDVCLDNVGGAVFDTMSRLVRWGGRLLPIGFTSGEIPSLAANLPLLKNYSVAGAFWGAWAQRFARESAAADEALLRGIAAGELRPYVSRVLPWEDHALATDAISTRQAQGRPGAGGAPMKAGTSLARLLAACYGVACYLVFLATFGYLFAFVGNHAVPRTIDVGPATPWLDAVLLDALLLAVFGLQHSAMARPAFKRAWTLIVPPALERSTYVLVASIVLAAVMAGWRPIPQPLLWNVEDASAALALDLVAWAGWLLVVASSYFIDHFEMFGLQQAVAPAIGVEAPAHAFRTPWLYRYVRHPLYLGFLLAFWATPHMTAGHLLFAVGNTLYILVGIVLEERDLVAAFGERYRTYQRQVGKLLPRWRS